MASHDESFYAGFYWGVREERVQDIAWRAEGFLRALAEISPLLAGWQPAFGPAIHEFTPDRKHLESLFRAGVNRKDIGKEVIPELGFRASLLSASSDLGTISLRMTAGVFSKCVSNLCLIELPPLAASDTGLLTVPTLRKLCEAVVASWEPDRGLVASHSLHTAVPQEDRRIKFGWLTYLSAKYGELANLPPPARVICIDGAGHLVVATDERFSSANPEHLDVLRRIIRTITAEDIKLV